MVVWLTDVGINWFLVDRLEIGVECFFFMSKAPVT